MKMKKTQSLKLMLLGLFALVSTGVWAQFTQVNGVVYDVSGANAKVVGVLSTLPAGEFGDGRYLDGTKQIRIEDVVSGKKVNGLAADWVNPKVKEKANTTTGTLAGNVTNTVTNADGSQTVTVTNDGGTTTTTVYPTIDATKLTAVELIYAASEITEVSRSDFEGLTVAGFILGGTSGITVIPENLFSGVTRTDVPNTARDEAIAAANALIGNGTSYVITDGMYGNQQVYRTISTFFFPWETAGTYVVVDENFTRKGANWDNDNYFVHPANAFNAEWKLEKEPLWTDVRISEDGNWLLRWNNLFHIWTAVAQKIEGNFGGTTTPGLQSAYETAQTNTGLAQAAWTAKDNELTDVKYQSYHVNEINAQLAQNAAKAQALKNAIEAFGNDQWWGELKKQLHNFYTNVEEENITPWFAAFTLATNTAEDLATANITLAYWQTKVDNFSAAYSDYFGTDPSALNEYYVDGYKFDSYGAVGDIFSHEGATTVNASSETFTHYADGVVEDCSKDALTDGTVKIGDDYYFKVKVLQNSIVGWNEKYFYVQLAANEADGVVTPVINNSAYYVLYEYKVDEKPAKLEGRMTNATTSGTLTARINAANPVVWTAEYTTAPNANLKNITFPNGQQKDKYVIVIPSGEHAGSYVIDDDFALYSVDSEYKATALTVTTTQKQMLPITFKPATTIVITPEVPASSEEVHMTAGIDNENNELYAWSGNESAEWIAVFDPSLNKNFTSDDNLWIKVGDNYFPATKRYTVTTGDNAGTYYLVGDYNSMYKEAANAKWTDVPEGDLSENDMQPGARYRVASAVMGTHNIAAVPAVTEPGEGENTTMVVKIGAKETYKYTLTPETAQTTIDSHDPYPSYMAVINANKPLDATELGKQITKLEGELAVLAQALENAKNAEAEALTALNNAKQQLKDAQDMPLFVDKYEYDSRKDNEDLYEVAFNNGIVTTIGDHAFANCVNAMFSNGTFPATMETVGEEAFLRTLIATADFSTATSEDLTIAADAFKATPLETLKLQGTTSEAITPELVLAIVQSLKRADADVTFCSATEPVTVENAIPSLTTVTLPETEIFDAIRSNTFNMCVNLSSVFVPKYVERIGNFAFNYTAVPVFDLTALEDLGSIGMYAFANNPALQTVKLAAKAPVDELLIGTFENSCQLATVKFNDAMTTLPRGLFATNALAALELCNTNVKYLPNLFLAGPGEEEGDRLPNTTLTEVCLPDGLLAIDHFALSSCKALTEVDIPGTVFLMGDGVFYNDVNLEKVTIVDSRMIGLPARTFSQCEKLSDLVFITLETINPNPFGNNVTQEPFMTETEIREFVADVLNIGRRPTLQQRIQLEKIVDLAQEGQCFGDNIFHGAGIYSTHEFDNPSGGKVHKTLVTVGYDSYMKLTGGSPVYAEAFSKLQAYDAKITFTDANKAGDSYWKTYQSKYGTWVKAGKGQIVYSAYQDGNTIVLYPAKIKNGYYKIAAYNGENDEAAASVIRSLDKEFSFQQKTNPDQKYQSTLDWENQLSVLADEFTGNSNLNVYYMAVQGTEPTFFKTIESITLPEGWVVFKTEGYLGQGARVVIIDEDEATAVLGVKEYLDGGAIYNLQGVRVSSPVKGQMYIQSGKKFIQK